MEQAVETRYKVSGMKCGGCVAKATEALSKLPGYVSAEFDLKSGKAVVNALTKAGYPADVEEG